MNAWKRLARAPRVQAVASRCLALYIRFVHATSRWQRIGRETPTGFWEANEPFIGCFWHGRLFMMPPSWRPGVPISVLISDHPDGRLIARTVARFGFDTIAGSTTRSGTQALRALLRALERGVTVCVTPDGPRGPRMRASGAIVDLARLSGRAIVPGAFATSRRVVAGSWDRFVVALPFSRGVYVWGEPIRVSRDTDAAGVEAARRLVEERLNAVTAEADRRAGAAAIEPAPVDAARVRV
jgi:hypothetical protein